MAKTLSHSSQEGSIAATVPAGYCGGLMLS